ncbi:MAG TPA: GNAT family N-acetyltransferase [Vicinamibacteria bacterium]|nr:GNAT family N-acetyltransferase [Vicinamibacteria bacterium]
MQPASPDGEVRREPAAPTLRPARESDLDFILRLCRKVFLEYGSYDRYVAEWFREEIVATCIAELESGFAGFFMLAMHPESPDGPVAELLSIAVEPELRSRGVGGALLERSIRLALDSSLRPREMRLSVAEGNARAQRMFARRGFRIGKAVGVYPAGQRALFMSKTLRKEGS